MDAATRPLTRNEYLARVEALAAIRGLHQRTTLTHLRQDCELCLSLDERRRELVVQWQGLLTG
jgi:hypothetical protein